MGRTGYIAALGLTAIAGLYFINRGSSQKFDTIDTLVADQRAETPKIVSAPLRSSYGSPQNQSSSQEPTPGVQQNNLQQGSLESRIYGSLVSEFADNLDATLHYGSEGRFKDHLVLGLKDIPADGLVANYEAKLQSLTGQERADLMNRYGAIVDFLKGKGSDPLDSVASSKGYLKIGETADRIWPKVRDSWQKSVAGDTFADAIDNDQLSSGQLERFVAHTNAYCNQVGIPTPNLLEVRIRDYQGGMAECDEIQKRMNSGQEVTDVEKRRMQDHVRSLGAIQDEFSRITSRDEAREKVRREIIASLNEINPLYGLAMEVVGLE